VRRFSVFAAVLVAALAAALSQASPAAAHGGASVTIHSDGRGSVWITARWQDGHPVDEPTPVTLTATPADVATPADLATPATPIAASKLTQTGDGRGTQTWSGVLPPGAWRVAIDLGAPVEGHCQALVPSAPGGASDGSASNSSAAAAQPVEVACLSPATAATGPAEDAASPAGSLAPLWVTLGVLLIAGLIAAEVVRRRRQP
jgi:hypothetical protein